MDENLTNVIEKAVNDFKGNRDNCKDNHLCETYLSLRITQAGYRLDPYPNGKSKAELIARIEIVEAERDKTRNLLRAVYVALNQKQAFVSTWKDCLAGVQMSEESFDEDARMTEHGSLLVRANGFLAETSTVKP